MGCCVSKQQVTTKPQKRRKDQIVSQEMNKSISFTKVGGDSGKKIMRSKNNSDSLPALKKNIHSISNKL